MTEKTYWNGESASARKVLITVMDDGFFPLYWAKEFVGQDRLAVEVDYNGNVFYLDDENGQGWYKVTIGKGSPRIGHRSLVVTNIRERND